MTVSKSEYITVTEAISWIAFNDFGAIAGSIEKRDSRKALGGANKLLSAARKGRIDIYGIQMNNNKSSMEKIILGDLLLPDAYIFYAVRSI